ncbi:hypothetical protein [Sharpea azabuensis]|uniref:hypothetical protein n=1 Tax=Sharpea azabuensis TaxID=322505 RepID=UPI00156A6D37|nr:hypothetical protein [Sharpea azabuensis]
MNVDQSEKQVLMSAFDQLLRHPEEKVRNLARDIAFYAYYSTYDTNTVNSFFDLVPFKYRMQYDVSLKRGLRNSKISISSAL